MLSRFWTKVLKLLQSLLTGPIHRDPWIRTSTTPEFEWLYQDDANPVFFFFTAGRALSCKNSLWTACFYKRQEGVVPPLAAFPGFPVPPEEPGTGAG